MLAAALVVGGAGAGELRGVPAMVSADPGCAAVGVPAVELAMGVLPRRPPLAGRSPKWPLAGLWERARGRPLTRSRYISHTPSNQTASHR